MTSEELLVERERITHDFITAMNEWLEAFNDLTDKMILQSEDTENKLRGA